MRYTMHVTNIFADYYAAQARKRVSEMGPRNATLAGSTTRSEVPTRKQYMQRFQIQSQHNITHLVYVFPAQVSVLRTESVPCGYNAAGM